MKIVPLDKKRLKEAINLVDSVFPVQAEEPASVGFRASLEPEKHKKVLAQYKIPESRYWLATADNKVVGTIGLYCYEEDRHEAYWLGWFCVGPSFRRKGTGTKLLKFSIDKAKRAGKRYLRLYTSTDPKQSDAHRLYEKHGFKLVGEEPCAGSAFRKMYYELKLSKKTTVAEIADKTRRAIIIRRYHDSLQNRVMELFRQGYPDSFDGNAIRFFK